MTLDTLGARQVCSSRALTDSNARPIKPTVKKSSLFSTHANGRAKWEGLENPKQLLFYCLNPLLV